MADGVAGDFSAGFDLFYFSSGSRSARRHGRSSCDHRRANVAKRKLSFAAALRIPLSDETSADLLADRRGRKGDGAQRISLAVAEPGVCVVPLAGWNLYDHRVLVRYAEWICGGPGVHRDCRPLVAGSCAADVDAINHLGCILAGRWRCDRHEGMSAAYAGLDICGRCWGRR